MRPGLKCRQQPESDGLFAVSAALAGNDLNVGVGRPKQPTKPSRFHAMVMNNFFEDAPMYLADC